MYVKKKLPFINGSLCITVKSGSGLFIGIAGLLGMIIPVKFVHDLIPELFSAFLEVAQFRFGIGGQFP